MFTPTSLVALPGDNVSQAALQRMWAPICLCIFQCCYDHLLFSPGQNYLLDIQSTHTSLWLCQENPKEHSEIFLQVFLKYFKYNSITIPKNIVFDS